MEATVNLKRTHTANKVIANLAGYEESMPQFAIDNYGLINAKITFYIGYDETGVKLLTDGDISHILDRVNEIYRQAAINFTSKAVDPEKKGRIDNLLKMEEYRIIQTDSSFHKLVAIDSGTQSLEVYFVEQYAGGHTRRGIAVGVLVGGAGSSRRTNNSLARMVAHEIGHACGLKDIYIRDSSGSIKVDSLNSTYLPEDCSSGMSYYDNSFNYHHLLNRLLMYGTTGANTTGFDISTGTIFGVGKNSAGNYDTIQVEVGLRNMHSPRSALEEIYLRSR